MQKDYQKQIDLFKISDQTSQLNPKKLISFAKSLAENDIPVEVIYSFLELGSLPHINKHFYQSELQKEWLDQLLFLVNKSNYHVGVLLKQRAYNQPDKILFQTIADDKVTKLSYQQIWDLVREVGYSILDKIKNIDNPVVGLYTPNSLAGALTDLACLSFNIKNVPIPANVSEDHLKFIIEHADITQLFVGGIEPPQMINNIPKQLENIEIILLPKSSSVNIDHIVWDKFLVNPEHINNKLIDKKFNSVKMDTPATIMYTSGTTANPKGIIFTQNNMISKRFSRALALPEINSDDIFLSYLPLYHTFGRFLEMMGAIFWCATYTFAESPSFKTLVKNMQAVQPSIFISIPKRWIQIYELIGSKIPLDTVTNEEIIKELHKISGGKLRLGLSAAGFLDPDVFQFFQRNGVQLLSGYGMTEATGGITMTPINDYVRDSVGIPLPGIEVKLGEDNELLLRGPYMTGHFHGKKIKSTMQNGWFYTGDIFSKKDEHYFIVDRKKEIYKNNRGQTISPQKIENMFQDFEAVKSVFLIGDGMPYNAVLIYPNAEWIDETDFKNDISVQEYFSSLIQSVNNFLAPYERIVNFTLTERNFSAEKGELTPKKTYKRKIILKNFADLINPIYEKDYIFLTKNDFEVRVPKWLLRKIGVISKDIRWEENNIKISNSDQLLPIIPKDKLVQIGDFNYTLSNRLVDFNTLIMSPELWLGNKSLVDFFGISERKPKHIEPTVDISIAEPAFQVLTNTASESVINDLKLSLRNKDFNLQKLHQAAVLLYSSSGYNLSLAMNYLGQILKQEPSNITATTVKLLTRLRYHVVPRTRMKALEILTPYITGDLFAEILTEIYLIANQPENIIDFTLDIRILQKDHFQSLVKVLAEYRHDIASLGKIHFMLIEVLLKTIANYGIKHPANFVWARAEILKWELSEAPGAICQTAGNAFRELTEGFRRWLGQNREIAIDRDTGDEYSWSDIIVFDPSVSTKYKEFIHHAISKTQLLSEAVFLFSVHRLIQIDDIQIRGIWITFIGENYGKSVFRVTVQARNHSTYNFVINLNEGLDEAFIRNEIRWLVTTGSSSRGPKLVEDFGGYWPDEKMYTEEYVSGETLAQYLTKNHSKIASGDYHELWNLRWLHFIWNGSMAYFSFCNRSNYKYFIEEASPSNLIIPEHDYAVGTRLISISNRAKLKSITELFVKLFENYILSTEKQYKGLPHVADWEIIFCVFFQTVTVKIGIKQLNALIEELKQKMYNDIAKKYELTQQRVQLFIDDVKENGLLTKQIVFASLRYERWLELNQDATLEARGSYISQLSKDYRLSDLLDDYPETRIRFFLMTCFQYSNNNLKDELLKLQKGLRAKAISSEDLNTHINKIHNNLNLSDKDEYFITRLLFEHLDAKNQDTEFVWDAGSIGKIELITTIEDNFGDRYQIRSPEHPKEIARFQTLLLNSNLSAIFNQRQEFLFIVNPNNQLVGGVYWEKTGDKVAYLERIVVSPKYRKRHLSSKLLDELINRLKDRQYKHITVGFFQAGLFYNKGFIIDKRFGGLVKSLE